MVNWAEGIGLYREHPNIETNPDEDWKVILLEKNVLPELQGVT